MINLSKTLSLYLSLLFILPCTLLASESKAVYIKSADGKDILFGTYARLQGEEFVFHTVPVQSELLCASQRVTGVHNLDANELIQSISKNGTSTVYAYRVHGMPCSELPILSYGSIGDAERDIKEQYLVYEEYKKFLIAFSTWQKKGNNAEFKIFTDSKKLECLRTNKTLNIFGYRVQKNGKASASIGGCLNVTQYDVVDIAIDKKGEYKVKVKFQLPPM